MDRNSILDLLALIRTQSVTLAAQTRNASQSAYSRRLQALEYKLKVMLVDRSKRPSGPTFHLRSLQLELETTLVSLNQLEDAFANEPTQLIRIAALHSISANILPRALKALGDVMAAHDIRLRSANLEICFQMLMTEEVAAMICYETETKRLDPPKDLVQRTSIGFDSFIPVCAAYWLPELKEMIASNRSIPLVCYPPEIFMGDLMRSSLLPQLPYKVSMKLVSGLTQSILAGIRCGLGCGWLPGITTSDDLENGTLVRIDHLGFPSSSLEITMLRLKTKEFENLKPTVEAICREISNILPARSEGILGLGA
ncbi:HTH-type transcriptional regulator YjiE (plasmid) [Pseudoseohaeicola sp. NH-UV-7]|uniref:LysR family transcriptional regulator n=1 Tax=unclassified Sulfitobacter TaxID=196795 RepID=UPI000E0C75D0|nr:LysR family transcriptional regulator [Sulfitobacter sp. JL08]AXI55106.1 hypothetical protein C1J05_11935 [Sulfitobacter sp. JL08]